MAEPRRAHGERGRERHRRVALAREAGEAQRDVHVGGREHPGRVELAHEPARTQGAADVEGVVGDHAAAPASSTSLSASTSAPDGRQANTPHGVPSITGVSGPVIPRRNR